MSLSLLFDKIKADLPTMQGWCTPEKGVHLAELVIERRPQLSVEIGVFGGRSLVAIAEALKHLALPPVYGIDPWEVGAALEGEKAQENIEWWSNKVDLEKIYVDFVRHVLTEKLTNECRWIRARSEQVVNMFVDRSIDFFHLDSNHSELVSCRDVALWEPRLKPSAIWVMDDTDWATQRKAIDMILARGFSVRSDKGSYIVFQRG